MPDLRVDATETVGLATKVFVPVREHLARMRGNDGVLETLNALAACAATVLRGTGPDPRALAFFHDALRDNLLDTETSMAMSDTDRDMLVQRAHDTVMSYAGSHSKADAQKYVEAVIVRLQSAVEGMKGDQQQAQSGGPAPTQQPQPKEDETATRRRSSP